MKKSRNLLAVIMILLMCVSCADSKQLTINGKETIVEPYGWMNQENKKEDVIYKINVGNMVLNVLFFETVVVPVWLSGTELYEPIGTVQK